MNMDVKCQILVQILTFHIVSEPGLTINMEILSDLFMKIDILVMFLRRDMLLKIDIAILTYMNVI